MKFVVEGIKCENCVKTIKNALSDFGEAKVEGGVVELAVSQSEVEAVKSEIEDLGFRVVEVKSEG